MLPRILIVGDSITQESFQDGGWGAAVADWYARRADVINRGFDGWNTRWILQNKDRIRRSLGPAEPGTYLWGSIMLGANDNSVSYQNVPIDEFEQNLRQLALWMRDEIGVPRVVLMAPPPYHAGKHTTARNLPLDKAPRSDERHGLYGDCAKRVAIELGMAFVSMRDCVREQLGDQWPDALSDGLHFNRVGQRIAFEAVKKIIETAYPEVAPVGPTLLPGYEDMAQWRDGIIPEEATHEPIRGDVKRTTSSA